MTTCCFLVSETIACIVVTSFGGERNGKNSKILAEDSLDHDNIRPCKNVAVQQAIRNVYKLIPGE